ncbi:hypothetical protein F0235_01570 [Vibrio splendidus]|uniref:hypothetical protein n=1 Tax=Vibrio splendidus TaxID=29497 RepID=UPI00148DB57A|nr:hypothetical protein [Vibrio splendidus]
MKTNNITFKLLITCCFFCLSNPVFAQSYWEVEGIGKNKSEATIDAKENLAFRVNSTVQASENTSMISETTTEIKNGELVGTHDKYGQVISTKSEITSVPISISNMEVMTSQCDVSGCNYLFRVDVDVWVDQLSIDIDKNHQIAQQYLTSQESDWKGAVFTNKAHTLLQSNRESLLVLSSLDHDVAKKFYEPQLVLERNVIKRIQNFSVSIRSASDMYSTQTKALLTQNIGATSQGDIIVYIKGNVRQGKKNNTYIAKQDLILQVFEARNPNVAVSQKVLSEIGKSSTSKEKALDAAHTKITKILNKNSIYTLLN